jgi:hypothetical protein
MRYGVRLITIPEERLLRSNNHFGGKAVANALQFKAMTGHSLSEIERNALEHAEKYLSNRVNDIFFSLPIMNIFLNRLLSYDL